MAEVSYDRLHMFAAIASNSDVPPTELDPIRINLGFVFLQDLGKPTQFGYYFSMTKLTPIESEFGTSEEAEAYDAWFRAEVEASLADTRPPIPHDQVMAELRAIIEGKKASRG